jgi:hypothetical protein
MRRLLIILPFWLALSLSGCPANDDDSVIDDGQLTIRGDVADLGGLPVVGAAVYAGEVEVVTDSAGEFELPPRAGGGQLAVAVRAEGFTTGLVILDLSVEAPYARVVLAELNGDVLDDVDEGGEVAGDDGTAITFAAGGSFLDASGAPVTGAVEVGFVVLNTSAEMEAAPPMELADGTPLESYGIFEVQLAQDGERLTFEGEATMRVPLATQLSLPDGELVDLFRFDEDQQAWVAEGQASIDGGFVVAELTHFSTWTTGLPFAENGCVSGLLELEDGAPAAGASVYSMGVDYLGVNATTSAADGSFCLDVKVDATSHLVGYWADPVTGEVLVKEGDVTVGPTPAVCASGGCEDVGVQVMTAEVTDDDGDGYTEEDGDCDDEDAGVFPAADDLPGDGIDSNCDGIDGTDQDADGWDESEDCDDMDPATYPGSPLDTSVDGADQDCDGLDGPDADGDGHADALAGGDDCDDSNAAVSPSADEYCDGLDNDCDGSLPPDEADADADGWRACDGDCEDDNDQVHPGMEEQCNGLDDDCADGPDPTEVDDDGDGWMPCEGDCDDTNPSQTPADVDGDGFSSCNGDCDDSEPDSYGGAPELCDGLDNSCFGSVGQDEQDADGDGQMECEGDCWDNDPAIYVGAVEVCDGLDNDCVDGVPADESDGDADGWMVCEGDCDDTCDQCWPGNPEICDGMDNDCNGIAEDGIVYTDWCQDNDGDGHGQASTVENGCDGAPAPNFVDNCDDCDDSMSSNFPGNPEICDTVDNDCDGNIDPDCP